jgi:aryl-alcohol dehydrogenase-like predicted oxidoreductase
VKDGERVRSQRSGGVKQYFTDDGWAVLAKVREVATRHSTTPSAVSLAWQMTVPGITAPIVGANTPEQFADQLPAVELKLSDAEIAALNAVSQPYLREGNEHQGS